MPKRAAIFDLDGTLVDSLPLVLKAFAHAIEPFGGPRPQMDIFARLGGPPDRVFHTLLGGPENVPAALARLAAYNGSFGHEADLFTGATHALERMRAVGARLAIWTGRDRGTTVPILSKHELEKWIDHVVCGDDFPSHKPDPEGLRDILVKLGVAAEEAIFVGDADVDVLGGHAAGIETILITHGREIPGEVEEKAWRVVATPEEAFGLVIERL